MNPVSGAAATCRRCGSELGPMHVVCPVCRALVYSDKLEVLSREAQTAEAEAVDAEGRGERRVAAKARREAIAVWREALACLPVESKQYGQISRHIDALGDGGDSLGSLNVRSGKGGEERIVEERVVEGRDVEGRDVEGRDVVSSASRHRRSQRRGFWGKLGGAAVAFGFVVWKLKIVFVFILSKGKILLLGLTKGSTFVSMALALGVYWAVFGWKFALGLVLSLYTHEMGHVLALRQKGIAAGAPIFIPGIGAFVRLRQRIADPHVDAWIGLAGPLGGLAAALFALALAASAGWPAALAIAKVGGWINLFNLLPVWQLDGGRAVNALTRSQRVSLALGVGVAWFLSGEGILLLILVGAIARLFGRPADERDRGALWLYLGLLGAFTYLSMLHVPLPR